MSNLRMMKCLYSTRNQPTVYGPTVVELRLIFFSYRSETHVFGFVREGDSQLLCDI